MFPKIAKEPAKKIARGGLEPLKVSRISSRSSREFQNNFHKLVVRSYYSQAGCYRSSIANGEQLHPGWENFPLDRVFLTNSFAKATLGNIKHAADPIRISLRKT